SFPSGWKTAYECTPGFRPAVTALAPGGRETLASARGKAVAPAAQLGPGRAGISAVVVDRLFLSRPTLLSLVSRCRGRLRIDPLARLPSCPAACPGSSAR